jgi:hypothetical protein
MLSVPMQCSLLLADDAEAVRVTSKPISTSNLSGLRKRIMDNVQSFVPPYISKISYRRDGHGIYVRTILYSVYLFRKKSTCILILKRGGHVHVEKIVAFLKRRRNITSFHTYKTLS